MNYKIVIDPGHGGNDPGASGNGIIEKDLNLLISKEMYEKFRSLGIPTYITRLDDSTLSPTERTKKILDAFGNDSNVIVISNHINSGGGDGAEVIYALRNTDKLSNLILNELEKAGQNVRKAYQRRLPSDPAKDYYFIHRDTGNTEPVIIEYGFLDSTGDDVNQLKNNYIKFADAVVTAVSNYIDLPYELGNVYIVKKGDSLYSIAQKYNTTVDELKKLNGLTSNIINVGQILKLPEKENIVDYDLYIVKKGDTLYKIANTYNISVNELKKINNLTSDTLSIGQQLLVPIIEESDYTIYIVKKRDSLYSIAQKYNTTVDSIKKLNNLASNLLSINQQLKIPTKKEEEVQNFYNYVVVPGDTLYSIAKNNNTTVETIKSINNLSSNVIDVGMQLKLPINFVYTVKKGDSLYSIAQKYNTTVDELKRKNNLSSNLLSIGQILII
ncbi:MAG: LysM peptidoglycan-binding domain-containing protein [Bacilli bacterium]|nr:LysM peptidoglycan-binding domain-containing protein [Bacilli bacterium]